MLEQCLEMYGGVKGSESVSKRERKKSMDFSVTKDNGQIVIAMDSDACVTPLRFDMTPSVTKEQIEELERTV